MLTSKEIIERTGISRATLNNYIASGLVPRPQVLPPGPEHGAAPRIGYFPDDTAERIETIQRLKREGWSITRIADHFAGSGGGRKLPAPEGAPRPVAPPPPPMQALESPAAAPRPLGRALTPAEADQPAYLVNNAFRLVWMNQAAQHGALSPLAGGVAAGSVFQHLLQLEEARGRDALLRFHLESAKSRDLPPAQVSAGLPHDDAVRLEALYGAARPAPGRHLVGQFLLPATGVLPARWVQAVHFLEGVLFVLAPQAAGEAFASRPAPAAAPAPPTLTPVAVLAGVLQDATGLWVRLAPEEYFELLNEIGARLDPVFRSHGGHPRRLEGESLACCFLPQGGGSYLWNALAAAHQAREAMRQVSQRWQARKGWDVELCLNMGLDEGQDWLGALGPAEGAHLRVLGDAADRAAHLARCARSGAILLTRTLVTRLARGERQRLTYGVRRPEGTPGDAPLLFTFARLADLAAPGLAPAAVADLAVAELVDLHSHDSRARPPGAADR